MKRLFLFVVAFMLSLPSLAWSGSLHESWGDLLLLHVVDGAVDYYGFKRDEKKLDKYLLILADTDPEPLSEQDRLAFYINAYNAYTVKLILENFSDGTPPSSIRKIGGFFTSPWNIFFAGVGGKILSLDNIEHDIIRKEFNEPRIHFAVNCASKSCPPLISEPYEGEVLNRQLEQSTRSFLADTSKNYFDGSTLYISSIFKWYHEDFNNDPVAFFRLHAGDDLQGLLQEKKDIRVKYLDYDWGLNSSET